MTGAAEPHPLPPPSDRRILGLALTLASAGSVDLSDLSDEDARAVWRVVRAIIAWRRERGLPQPHPGKIRRLPPARMKGILRIVAKEEDPFAIVAEIMAEPLLQATLWVLAAMVARAAKLPPPPLVVSLPTLGGGQP